LGLISRAGLQDVIDNARTEFTKVSFDSPELAEQARLLLQRDLDAVPAA